jgi:MarR family transcriptional regulator for hemolysin
MIELLALFTRAHKLLRAAADDAMRQHGVRIGQNIVLEVLWETDGLTPGELAARLHVTTPTVVNTATRMENAGLLTRRRDTQDARLVRLYLTDQARAAQQPIEEARQQLEQRAFATLTSQERRHLRSALTKIIQVMGDESPSVRSTSPRNGAETGG